MGVTEFKNNLNQLMKDRNLTINTLSRISGISKPRLYSYTNPNNYNVPRVDTLEVLADTFGISMDELYK